MSVVIVLHEPQDLVNIAHVVRALKNFGWRDLRLVNPREYDAHRIEGIAHQTEDVLARVRRFERLEDALSDCTHVVGFTARERSAKRNMQRPRAAAGEILAQSGGEAGAVALLFGREDKGLPNEALDLCHRVVTVSTNPAYPSLNLAHAVVLMLYELALARGDEARPFKPPRREGPPAKVEDVERLSADVEGALRAIDFFKTRQMAGVMRTLREVIHRTPLDEREVKLLRASRSPYFTTSIAIARSSYTSRSSSGVRWITSRSVRITPAIWRVLKKSIARNAPSTSANSRSRSSDLAGGPSRRGGLKGRASSPRASASSYSISTTACARLRDG